MNTSTTLKTILAVLVVFFTGHAFVAYKVHKSTTFEHEFFDHRHLEGFVAGTPTATFDPITITEQHLTSELYLPEALRYPLYANESAITKTNPEGRCCEMYSIRGRSPRNLQCEGVCNTERACKDKYYPFKSLEEVQLFREKKWNETTFPILRTRCRSMNRRLAPPHIWCYQWREAARQIGGGKSTANKSMEEFDFKKLEQYNHQNINPYEAKLPPPGCSRTSEGGGSGAYQHLTLFPEAKLAFCGIPKVSITQWLQFLR